MKEIVIISGKGGTGKTSLAGSFAALAKDVVIADCDVGASNLHLILNPEIQTKTEFKSGFEATIRSKDCTGCGICHSLCKFESIKEDNGFFAIDPTLCEGCSVCVRFCPEAAIDFTERTCGEWFSSKTRFGPMVHASLGIGAENSGKLVSMVRQEAKRIATESHMDFILVDGPPGIACPVIASITGADAVVIVTEPTLSGESDLTRAIELTKHFNIPTFVCVNKWDINPSQTAKIIKIVENSEATWAGRIGYSPEVTRAQIEQKCVLELEHNEIHEEIKSIWETVCDNILNPT